jgi:hypothetical protein
LLPFALVVRFFLVLSYLHVHRFDYYHSTVEMNLCVVFAEDMKRKEIEVKNKKNDDEMNGEQNCVIY